MRNFLYSLYIVFFVLCFSLVPLHSATGSTKDTPEEQLGKLQEVYRNLSSISFNFSQLTRTGLRNRPGKGTAVFVRMTDPKKPGIMRWNYTQPAPQVILNDGTNLSIYTEKDHQLIVTSAAELNGDITYAFFSGTRNLTEEFQAEPPNDRYGFAIPDTTITALKLVPRTPHPQIKAVQIWFDNTLLIHRILLEDHFDSITELTFTNIQTNTVQGDDLQQVQALLDLNLPENTEIISQ